MKKTLALMSVAAVAFSSATIPTATSQPTPVTNKLSIVQLGDSFSAGNGAGSYYGPPQCLRSTLNWGQHFTTWVNELGISATYDNRACSGGVTDNILNSRVLDRQDKKSLFAESAEDALAKLESADACGAGTSDDIESVDYNIGDGGFLGRRYTYECQLTLKPQAEFVGAQTDLVLMTIGGNDVNFATIVEGCFAPRIWTITDGASLEACRTAVEAADDQLGTTMATVEATINALLRDRMTGRPTSQVVLMGYPLLATAPAYVLEDDGESYDASKAVRDLGLKAVGLQRELVDRLNETWGGRVVYIDDVTTAFAGHEPDPVLRRANPQRWLNEFLETNGDAEEGEETSSSRSFTPEYFFHPNRIGHRELAKLVQTSGLTENAPLIGGSSSDIDVVFAIDTTGSMRDDIASVRTNVATIVEDIRERSGTARFALVTYQDHPSAGGSSGDYPSRVEVDFTSETSVLRAGLDALELGHGGDGPESVYSGIDAGLSLQWRPGVRKTLLVLGDAPPKDPEPVTNLTWQQVADKAYAVDPVQIYVVDTSRAADANLTALVEESGGKVFEAGDSGEIPDLFVEAVTEVLDKPFAWLQGPYVAKVGSELVLDARGSHATGASITSYEWDFDGDGEYDATTSAPTVTHRYDEEIRGFVGVRVTDERSQQSVGSTRLNITRDGDEIPDEFDNCPDVSNPTQQDADADGIGDECQAEGHFTIEDVGPGPSDPEPTPPPATPTPTPSPTPVPSPTPPVIPPGLPNSGS